MLLPCVSVDPIMSNVTLVLQGDLSPRSPLYSYDFMLRGLMNAERGNELCNEALLEALAPSPIDIDSSLVAECRNDAQSSYNLYGSRKLKLSLALSSVIREVIARQAHQHAMEAMQDAWVIRLLSRILSADKSLLPSSIMTVINVMQLAHDEHKKDGSAFDFNTAIQCELFRLEQRQQALKARMQRLV